MCSTEAALTPLHISIIFPCSCFGICIWFILGNKTLEEVCWAIKMRLYEYRASLVFQLVENLPAMQETLVWSLGGEEPLQKEMATPIPVFLPGECHGQRRLVGYCPRGCKESDTTEWLAHTHTYKKEKFLWNFLIL